jgi:Zinc-binding loop region of homing endonuclease
MNFAGSRGTVADRFWAKVIPEPNSGCWLWLGALGDHGYGHMHVLVGGKKRTKKATHISLELDGRPILNGLDALHRCDNRICVNPGHLVIGTRADNNHDTIRKGRHSPPPHKTKEA